MRIFPDLICLLTLVRFRNLLEWTACSEIGLCRRMEGVTMVTRDHGDFSRAY
jgi:hypothetical protein